MMEVQNAKCKFYQRDSRWPSRQRYFYLVSSSSYSNPRLSIASLRPQCMSIRFSYHSPQAAYAVFNHDSPDVYPFRNHHLGVSRWQAIGWRLPLGVSHWLPHRPFAQESRQSHYLTASFFPTSTMTVPFFILTFIYLCIHVIQLSVAL
jgi:hypothetical protein